MTTVKKSYTVLIIIAVIVILILIYVNTYNKLISLNANVDNSWAQFENQLQRRYDLIPNLVATVKGYMKFEQETLVQIAEARASVGKATTQNQKINANSSLDSAISRLLVVVEQYPDLKANQQFQDLMTELAGTENRISVERKRYNEDVTVYNKYISFFPQSLIAKRLGFEKRQYYQINENATTAPQVNFNP